MTSAAWQTLSIDREQMKKQTLAGAKCCAESLNPKGSGQKEKESECLAGTRDTREGKVLK